MATLSQLATQPLESLGEYLFTAYENFKGQAATQYAEIGVRYYEQQNDILKTRIMYQNDEGDIVEDTTATNTRIAHGFFPELVDQKVQYIMTDDGIAVSATDDSDSQLEEYLQQYFNEDWQLVMQELIEGAAVKGFEGLFARTTAQDTLRFQIADAMKLVPVFDEFGKLVRVLRYYSEARYSSERTKTVIVQHCDVWDEQQVAYYTQIQEGSSMTFKLDTSIAINPAPHVTALVENPDFEEGSDESERWLPLGRSYSRFPFHILQNNRQGFSDLRPIKEIVDDYDLMNCFLSNNLQDMSEAFYVVKGYNGESVDRLKQNIKSRKVVNLAPVSEAGVDIQTYNIPTEGRKTKMELDEVNIYRAGMGFNSQQLGDGNITNVVIKSRYALLAMKAAKVIARLKACLKWQAELVAADINRRFGGNYVGSDITFTIEPQTITNESDIITDKKTEAETKQLAISTILLAAPRIGDEETLRLICETYDLDFDEVQGQLEDEEADGVDDKLIDPVAAMNTDSTAAPADSTAAPADKTAATMGADGQPLAAKDSTVAQVSMNGAQISAILEIVASVNNGSLSRESAIALLTSSFPFDAAKASEILGAPTEVKPAAPVPPAFVQQQGQQGQGGTTS